VSAPPYMKLYVADYLGDTHHLSALEHGAYLLLLMGMWRAGGKLPADDGKLARVARCTPEEWAQVRETVLEFFRRRGGVLTHKRIAQEMAKYETVSLKRAEASKEGVAAKRRKNSGLASPNGADDANHLVAKPEPEPKGEEEPPNPPQAGGMPDDVETAFRMWNTLAVRLDLNIAKTLDRGRRRAIARALEAGGIGGWSEALAGVERSACCRGLKPGQNGMTLKADLTFVCRNFARLREGFYGYDAPAAPLAGLGSQVWPGPPELRAAIVEARGGGDRGEAYARSWLDRCSYRGAPEKLIVCPNEFVLARLNADLGDVLAAHGVSTVVEAAA
jgi:uncharacterized protein YdaU (DUF1376 family)